MQKVYNILCFSLLIFSVSSFTSCTTEKASHGSQSEVKRTKRPTPGPEQFTTLKLKVPNDTYIIRIAYIFEAPEAYIVVSDIEGDPSKPLDIKTETGVVRRMTQGKAIKHYVQGVSWDWGKEDIVKIKDIDTLIATLKNARQRYPFIPDN